MAEREENQEEENAPHHCLRILRQTNLPTQAFDCIYYIATLNSFYCSTIDLRIHALITKLKKAVLFVKFIYSDEMHCNNEFNRGRSKLFGYILPQTICWCALTHQFVDTGVMRK